MALFRFDQAFLTGIWIGTILYGVNVVVFLSAMFVLLRRRTRSGGGQLFLTGMAIWLISLSTAYVAITFRQLLEAFIFGPPGGAMLYFLDESHPIALAKLVLYQINVTSQNLILIWRIWVVFNKKWIVVALPAVLECIHMASGFIAVARGSRGVAFNDPTIHTWSLVYWSTDLTINIGVTTLLALKLWLAARGVPQARRYAGVILTMVESGCLFAGATVVTVALYVAGNPSVVTALDSLVQLASITPMLIVVRVGLVLHRGGSANSTAVFTSIATSGTLGSSSGSSCGRVVLASGALHDGKCVNLGGLGDGMGHGGEVYDMHAMMRKPEDYTV